MTTTLARVQVTLTQDVDRAMDVARQTWPDLPASQQLASLVKAGAEALTATKSSRREALKQTAGMFHGVYPDGYLDDLRQDWS